ncbi:MAG: acetolactate decarboxylase [Methanolinea sp.]|nr:acetolactate decarboxylase [Methanolinea sp.]
MHRGRPCCGVSLGECGECGADRDTLFQVSTIGALMEGDYRGHVTFGELKGHGDFGIGTFEALDGEMVAVDGRYWQVTADGCVHPVTDGMETPFAAVTFFEPDIAFTIPRAENYSDFSRQVREALPSENMTYAVRVRGEFLRVLARSVPRQGEPYPRLADAVKNQSVFPINGTRGVAAGFYVPEYAGALNVPGFHLHYIADDGTRGGHVLDLSAEGVTVELDETPRFCLILGGDGGDGGKIPPPVRGEVERIEKSG